MQAILQKPIHPSSPQGREASSEVMKETSVEQAQQEQALIRRTLAGEKDAFLVLYQRHAPSLLRRLTRLTGSLEVAEDCLQQLFVHALQHLREFRGEGTLHAWLNRIALHIVMDRFRREQTRQRGQQQLSFEEDARSEHTAIPEHLFFAKERKELLYEAIAQLSPQKRMVLLLCDLEGYRMDEAAQTLEIPMGTAASRLHHARHALRRSLERALKQRNLSLQDWLR